MRQRGAAGARDAPAAAEGARGPPWRPRARERVQRGDTTAGRCRDRRAPAARRGGRGCTFRAPGSRHRERAMITCLSTAGTHDVRVRVRRWRPSLPMNSVRAACEVGPTRHAGGFACRRVTVRGRLYSYSYSYSHVGSRSVYMDLKKSRGSYTFFRALPTHTDPPGAVSPRLAKSEHDDSCTHHVQVTFRSSVLLRGRCSLVSVGVATVLCGSLRVCRRPVHNAPRPFVHCITAAHAAGCCRAY